MTGSWEPSGGAPQQQLEEQKPKANGLISNSVILLPLAGKTEPTVIKSAPPERREQLRDEDLPPKKRRTTRPEKKKKPRPFTVDNWSESLFDLYSE